MAIIIIIFYFFTFNVTLLLFYVSLLLLPYFQCRYTLNVGHTLTSNVQHYMSNKTDNLDLTILVIVISNWVSRVFTFFILILVIFIAYANFNL